MDSYETPLAVVQVADFGFWDNLPTITSQKYGNFRFKAVEDNRFQMVIATNGNTRASRHRLQ